MKMIWDRNQTRSVLVLILVAALGLRLWGIWFGLPFSYNADEYHEVFRALELGSGGFNFERTGKGGYFYVLFIEYGVFFVALMVAGIVDSAQDFARYFVRDPSNFYLIGRATTAVIGTLNVFLVYRLGYRAYSIGAGLLAAGFLTIDFLNAGHSHFITVDVPMTCLATASLLFAVKMATDGTAREYKWAALFAALATTTKSPAILLLVPLLIAHYYFVKREGGGTRQFFLSRNLWWAVGIFVVVLAVTNPGLFVNPPLLTMFADVDNANEESMDQAFADPAHAGAPNLFTYYMGVLGDSMGWPLLLASLAGVLYALWKRTPADVILVSFALVFYVAFSSTSSHLYYPRYMLPVIVVLVLMAGRLLYALWPRAGAAQRAVALAFVAALAFLPGYRTVANNYLLSQTDTRTIAKEWFEESIPEGAKVLIEGVTFKPSGSTVPLEDTVENIHESIKYYRTREPGKAKYLGFKLQVVSGSRYDLEFVWWRNIQSLDHYKKMGIEYLVIRPEALMSPRHVTGTGATLLAELRSDPEVTLVKIFRPDPVSRPGPLIEIYRIQQDRGGASGVMPSTAKQPADDELHAGVP